MKTITIIFSLGIMTSLSCQKKEELTVEEVEDLTFLREEEKLARDVYLYAFDKYGEDIFTNIAATEEKHMNKVLTILNDYDISDPASNVRGEFTNQVLQNLYNDLTFLVDSSLVQALKVGATIEDLDINDINLNISRTDKDEILDMYEKLNCGSRNHMRAFTNALTENNETYTVQYISESDYDAILASSNESCGWYN
ncbi:MAG TPA: DUF2202 domain-containing protein [Crocinitomix sp.]|nr:DUF2202 domain-containing protein [Crocinitomix sp.]